MKNKNIIIYLIAALVLMLSGCADTIQYTGTHELVGFWHGVWHGNMVIFAWIWSLFDPSVTIYATYNNGGWYNFGYI